MGHLPDFAYYVMISQNSTQLFEQNDIYFSRFESCFKT
jgi:hypothetical protein